jgi:hypothetical protein
MADEVTETVGDFEAFLGPTKDLEERSEQLTAEYDSPDDGLPSQSSDLSSEYEYDEDEDLSSGEPEGEPGDEKPTQTAEDSAEGEQVAEDVLEQAELRGLSKDDVLKLRELGLLEKIFPAKSEPSDEDVSDEPSGDATSLDDLELNDEYDPVIREAFGKAKAKIADLEARLNRLQEIEQERTATEQTRQIDAIFQKYQDDLGDVLGVGSRADLDESSPAFKARLEVLKQVGVLAAGYEAKKQPVPDLEKLMEQAINALHGPKLAAKQRQRIKNQLKQNAPQFVGVASRRSPPQDLNPEAVALRNLEARLKALKL